MFKQLQNADIHRISTNCVILVFNQCHIVYRMLIDPTVYSFGSSSLQPMPCWKSTTLAQILYLRKPSANRKAEPNSSCSLENECFLILN
jgi:hypothetical protein